MGKDKSKHKHRDEDPDQREKRRARKKAEKVAKMFGYSNETNPFGDSNLLQPFVWGKKKEKDKQLGKVEEDSEQARLSLIQDIDRVRKRRAEREAELEEMERLRAEEMRLREAAQYVDWETKEEEFHMNQTRVRSKIRLIEKREKPIDLLAQNILLVESAFSTDKEQRDMGISLANLDMEMADPLSLLDGLSDADLVELMDDSETYLDVEKRKGGPYVKFWESLHELVCAERRRKNRREQSLHKAVMEDVKQTFRGKSSSDLLRMRDDIRKSIREGRRSDVEYWEQMERETTLEYHRAVIRETHRDLLDKQIEALSILKAEAAKAKERENQEDSRLSKKRPREGEDFRFISPPGGSASSSEPQQLRASDEARWKGMDTATCSSTSEQDSSADAISLQKREEEKGLEEMEEQMLVRDEVAVSHGTYWWQDKYRPRKPRYFNRVKTGYDWNKYNTTHYDHDNPPPKTIQGYKFNIFYPDLIDKTQTPKYYLEAADEPEFAIIRFHAGPPYEDIAFKILNQEWEIGKKTGFKCIFERGVLQLYFNFKRHRYRR
mmetsp:Transcript_9978/g.15061  ORF Transcript_9978/g.15061 Transcript_9978/m.15061 type:complete len:550 (-) Transcript_9978:165-1814(-)|eukprot:CAMPEP_0185037242 /NCGR_PEP_ID=MMETSP1103-20130426/31383_1 /TAXON_ID=36769 /ORGANISM="Paraphysomonas bandaiensis, Strain Caron Lab Isolate" /LENGTH=549 /DNA_ID=CAMNT_0027575137 /DNA_START=31 /DNA_END=1680 /DNA_ORIENTATION=-